MKNIKFSKATNVQTKFIPFFNDMWKKELSWSIQFYKEIDEKGWSVCESFPFAEGSYELVMVAR